MRVLASRVLLRPSDFDRSLRFYEEQLGLARFREWGDPPHRGVVFFIGGGYLELGESGDREPATGVRLWLQVDDMTAAREELVGAGVEIRHEPERKPWGLIEMSIADPDGLELVVVEVPVEHPLRRRQ